MSGSAMPTGYGAFCWNQLNATELEPAAAFFREVAGWESRRERLGPLAMDLVRRPGDAGFLASLMQVPPGPGARSAWLSYVRVEDLDGTCARVEGLGGRLQVAPTELPGVGRFAVLSDPQGATLGLFHRPWTAGDPEPVPTGVGAFHWYELVTRDLEAVRAFYSALLGWRFEVGIPALGPYTLIFRGADQVGGLWQPRGPGWASVPGQWLPYLQVQAVDPLVRRMGALGGQVRVPPTDIPDVGRFTVVADPGGAVCALVERRAGQGRP
jgi:uncharacterized protein